MDPDHVLVQELRAIAAALERADALLRRDQVPAREAVQYELISAACSVGRALHLIGDSR